MDEGATAVGDPRERLLAAAARYFRSPDYGILSDVAVKRIAADAGMSEAQARRYFLVDELHDELVRYMLTPGRDPETNWETGFFDVLEAALNDPRLPIDVTLQEGVNRRFEQTAMDPEALRLVSAPLLPYAASSELIAEALAESSEYWNECVERILMSFVARHADILHLRSDWISIEDFAVLVNVISSGLAKVAYLHRVRRRADEGYGVAPDLFGRTVRAVIGSMLQLHDDDEHPLDAHYRRINEKRAEAARG